MFDFGSPADQLQLLRQIFTHAERFEWAAEWPLDASMLRAAVLIPLVVREQGLQILLTRRTDHLQHHPGQISFPGGRIESYDVGPIAAALREASEEIGLQQDEVELLGMLPEYATSTGFRIVPVVGVVQPEAQLTLDPFEVAELFEVPMHFVMTRTNYQLHRVERPNLIRHFYAIPHGGRFIWGATAGMLAMLSGLIEQGRVKF